jgi:hypothetical protein
MAKKGKVKVSNVQRTEERPIRSRIYKQFFLIVCEDEATEPAYFKQFQILFDKLSKETLFLKSVGTGRDPKGVIEQAILERAKLKLESYKEVDFVWVVFDKDDADENQTKMNRFEQAFSLAKKEKMEVAYSNEVFELWLLLHLANVPMNHPIPRKEIYDLLESAVKSSNTKYGNFKYEHGNPNIIDIIAQIGQESHAIKKAEKLLEFHQNKPPIEQNPSTTVHLLVKILRDWIRYYQYED